MSITFRQSVNADGASYKRSCVYKLDTDKILYFSNVAAAYTAKVGTISGENIFWGTEVTIDTGNDNNGNLVCCCQLDTDKAFLMWCDAVNQTLDVMYITVSGTTITKKNIVSVEDGQGNAVAGQYNVYSTISCTQNTTDEAVMFYHANSDGPTTHALFAVLVTLSGDNCVVGTRHSVTTTYANEVGIISLGADKGYLCQRYTSTIVYKYTVAESRKYNYNSFCT